MTTQKQIEANRRNAQLSTGPQTAEGKAAVSQNAVRHGFTAAGPVIPGENLTDFETFKAGLLGEINPQGPAETMLADRIVDLSWRLRRSGRLHVAAYTLFSAGSDPALDPEAAIGQAAIRDFTGANVIDKLLIHERRIETSLYKTITELQRLQFIRTKYQSLLMDGKDYDDSEIREIARRNEEFYQHAQESARRLETSQNDPNANN